MSAVTLIGYFVALALPVLTIYLFVTLDVFGTGRPSTILWCAAWGALGAFFLAWGANSAVLARGVSYALLTTAVAPVIEELLKALVLIYLVQNPRFRYIVDGAVYGIAAGLGFALSENLFIYLPQAGGAVLGVALSRALSTSLMHATASGLVGISLGRLRRSTDARRKVFPLVGIGLAILLHATYNNLAARLEGLPLLLVAIGVGVGGGVVIAWEIVQGLADEKRRFTETLSHDVDVSEGEREAVQRLGETGIEHVFHELRAYFGDENIALIRRLLSIQANIGILRNNLQGPASERLRRAWEEEIAAYQEEMEDVRRQLGRSVLLFVQRVFPASDQSLQNVLNDELSRFDPTFVHRFDMFMRISGLAETFTPEQLSTMAERLSQIDIFRDVSLANLENLSRAIKVQEFADGTVLFNAGDEGNAMYLVDEGQIAIYVPSDGGEKLLRTFEPGSVVGEFSLLDGRPRSARAQAVGPVRALMLERQVFTMFIQSRPQVVLAMLRYLADKVRYTTRSVEAAVEWMTRISRGEYMPAEAEAAPAAAQPAMPEVIVEPDTLSSETPEQVSGVFSAVASQLYEREHAIRKRLSGSFPSGSERDVEQGDAEP